VPAPVFPFPIAEARPLHLAGSELDVRDLEAFEAWLVAERGDAPAMIGGYGENRGLYAGSQLFDQGADAIGEVEEARTLHLGIDIWTEAGTPVAAPVPGVIHSFADNNNFGDYGGTIILEHRLEEETFYTLYGHLAKRSLQGLENGRAVAAGQVIAWLGEPSENGGWPPHLHFQRINDLLGKRGDFPGVAKFSEQKYWLGLCPDPSSLLV
jgi:peptidoglycan LD-endopeptidase LytH